MKLVPLNPDPKLDLVLQREIDVPRELVWRAWTEARHLKQWFVPRPWTVSECEVDPRPGGIFRATMRSPEGQEFPNLGCYLEVVPLERLVWTDALLPGFRPAPEPVSGAGLFFTAALLLEPSGSGTRYTAYAIHRSPEDRQKHEAMGFHDGWGTVVDQLVQYLRETPLD